MTTSVKSREKSLERMGKPPCSIYIPTDGMYHGKIKLPFRIGSLFPIVIRCSQSAQPLNDRVIDDIQTEPAQGLRQYDEFAAALLRGAGKDHGIDPYIEVQQDELGEFLRIFGLNGTVPDPLLQYGQKVSGSGHGHGVLQDAQKELRIAGRRRDTEQIVLGGAE